MSSRRRWCRPAPTQLAQETVCCSTSSRHCQSKPSAAKSHKTKSFSFLDKRSMGATVAKHVGGREGPRQAEYGHHLGDRPRHKEGQGRRPRQGLSIPAVSYRAVPLLVPVAAAVPSSVLAAAGPRLAAVLPSDRPAAAVRRVRLRPWPVPEAGLAPVPFLPLVVGPAAARAARHQHIPDRIQNHSHSSWCLNQTAVKIMC